MATLTNKTRLINTVVSAMPNVGINITTVADFKTATESIATSAITYITESSVPSIENIVNAAISGVSSINKTWANADAFWTDVETHIGNIERFIE